MGIADEIMAGISRPRTRVRDTHPDEWDIEALATAVIRQFGFDMRAEGIDADQLGSKELEDALIEKAHEKYDQKEAHHRR